MRYRSRKGLHFYAGWILKVVASVTLLACFISMLSNRSHVNLLTTKYYLVPRIPRTTDPELSISEISNNVSMSVMNIFRGYGGTQARERTDPADHHLYDKLIQAQDYFKHPLFRLKTKNDAVMERHPWKFEKIIHQTWISESIPGRTVPWVKSWLKKNPDWTYMFWTDQSARLFIQNYFPSLLPAYDSWTIPVQKADMFRYIALYAFGGVYADLDMEALRPLDDIRDWSSCVLSREPDVQTYIMSNFMNCWANNYTFTCNAMMACRSHHPFMLYTIAQTIQKSPLVRGHPCHLNDTIGCTGPFMMSFAYGFYRRSIGDETRSKHRHWDVICPEFEWFLPTFDETRLDMVRRGCKKRRLTNKQRHACDVYKNRGEKNVPMNYSYTTHHWFHSYHYNVNKEVVDIDTVTNNIKWDPVTEDKYFDIRFTPSDRL